MANKLRASGQIQDKDRYISVSEAKKQMVAMLEELQLEIAEMKMEILTEKDIWNNAIDVCSNRIQQKINALKE